MIKLLLVEDDPNLRYVVQCGLEETFRPDIIISDIDMPVMDGFEMVRRIRETDADTPILFASALTSPKDVKHGYELGVNNYVKKPFIADELDAHIHAILKMTQGTHTRTETGFCKFGSYTLDTEHGTLRNDRTGQRQTLTATETKLLQILAQNRPPRSHPEPLLEHGRRLLRLAQPRRLRLQAPQALRSRRRYRNQNHPWCGADAGDFTLKSPMQTISGWLRGSPEDCFHLYMKNVFK